MPKGRRHRLAAWCLPTVLLAPLFGGCGWQAYFEQWEAVSETDTAEAYYEFLAQPEDSRYSPTLPHFEEASQAFLERYEEESAVEFKIQAAGIPESVHPKMDLAFPAYAAGYRDVTISLSMKGHNKYAEYVEENGNIWARPRRLATGGDLAATLSIAGNASGATLWEEEFRFDRKVADFTAVSIGGEPARPVERLYEGELVVEMIAAFARHSEDRIRFLFDLGRTHPQLCGLAARRCLIRAETAEDLKDPQALEYVIDLLQNSGSIWSRAIAAGMLSYTEDPAAIDALIQEVRKDNDDIRWPVYDALSRIGGPAVAPLLAMGQEDELQVRAAIIFEKMANEHAIDPLITLLAAADTKQTRRRIRGILEEKTGLSMGDDPQAWRQAWNAKQQSLESSPSSAAPAIEEYRHFEWFIHLCD